MAFAAMEPILTASAREWKKSLTLINFKRFQACFGWAKNGSSLGYGAWLKYTRIGGKTVRISMLLGILPVQASTKLSAVSSFESLPDAVARARARPEPLPAASTTHRSILYLFLRQPWLLVFLFFRCLKLGLIFGPLLILYVFMHDIPQLKMVWLHLLLKAFQTSGPTFMKFGQWMSTRRDIFSPELCAIFSTLHRRTPPHSFRHTEKEMNRAFGKSWKRHIVFTSKLPVGSGCVGQVYKVKVASSAISVRGPTHSRDDSLGPFDITPIRTPEPTAKTPAVGVQYVDAALKVLHPNIENHVNRDLVIMEIGANILEFIFKSFRWLRLRDSVLAFSDLMQKQLDLRVEAQNLEVFRENFANFESVTFPAPHYPFVTKHVLMESWEDGVPISHYLDNKVPQLTKQKLASIGADALLKMTFLDNFVHADMHPGNLFVKNPGNVTDRSGRAKMVFEDIGDLVVVGMHKSPLPLQLVIIDAGLTASLSQYDFDSFRGVFAAVVKGDGNLVADKFLFHAAADACSDRAGFRRDMSKLVHEARSRELSLTEIDVGQLLSDLFNILVKYQVKLESNFVSIMLSIMVCEGLARSLDPNLDLLEKARPILLRKLIF